MRSGEEKIVGSSLEVDILIQSENADNQKLLEKYKKELGDLYIVSHVFVDDSAKFEAISEFKQDGYKVKVQKATGKKCERCWKYRELNSDGICEDCAQAINC